MVHPRQIKLQSLNKALANLQEIPSQPSGTSQSFAPIFFRSSRSTPVGWDDALSVGRTKPSHFVATQLPISFQACFWVQLQSHPFESATSTWFDALPETSGKVVTAKPSRSPRPVWKSPRLQRPLMLQPEKLWTIMKNYEKNRIILSPNNSQGSNFRQWGVHGSMISPASQLHPGRPWCWVFMALHWRHSLFMLLPEVWFDWLHLGLADGSRCQELPCKPSTTKIRKQHQQQCHLRVVMVGFDMECAWVCIHIIHSLDMGWSRFIELLCGPLSTALYAATASTLIGIVRISFSQLCKEHWTLQGDEEVCQTTAPFRQQCNTVHIHFLHSHYNLDNII